MKTLIHLLTIAATFYVVLAVMLYLLQGRMVFLAHLPGRALTATPEIIGLDYEDVAITTNDGEQLHGWYVPALDSRGVLLFFHGNAGNISHRLDSIKIFHDLGLNVLIIDYRGYGQSTGSPGEQGTYRDAQAAWDYLNKERGIAPDRIVVFGRSLGGAVGAWLAGRYTPAGLIIESSFTSAVDVARQLYRYLPARLITRLKYRVVDYVQRASCPVLVIHSRQDEILPFAMGEGIYAAAKPPKSFLELKGDHNYGFVLSGEVYINGLRQFIHDVLPAALTVDQSLADEI